jgi:hypothetical protein
MRNHELEVTGQPPQLRFGIEYIDQQIYLRKYDKIHFKKIYDMYFIVFC